MVLTVCDLLYKIVKHKKGGANRNIVDLLKRVKTEQKREWKKRGKLMKKMLLMVGFIIFIFCIFGCNEECICEECVCEECVCEECVCEECEECPLCNCGDCGEVVDVDVAGVYELLSATETNLDTDEVTTYTAEDELSFSVNQSDDVVSLLECMGRLSNGDDGYFVECDVEEYPYNWGYYFQIVSGTLLFDGAQQVQADLVFYKLEWGIETNFRLEVLGQLDLDQTAEVRGD